LSTISEKQLQMARAALGWSFEDFARHTGVSARTIRRIESEGGLAVATQANIKLIVTTLEAAGIEFIGAPDDGPGVRLWLHFDSQ
jgi:transcriptional regulator with XRE-family HTH domain